MAKYNAKSQFRAMMRWAIKKMFEQNKDISMSLFELKQELQCAWDELVENGDIEIKQQED